MKYELIDIFYDDVDIGIFTLVELQAMFPGDSRRISHLVPGTRIRVPNNNLIYCLLDSELDTVNEL